MAYKQKNGRTKKTENLALLHFMFKKITLSRSIIHVFEDYFMFCSEQIVNTECVQGNL